MSTFPDADYPDRPYPGTRPLRSYVHLDGKGHELEPAWTVDGEDLDDWLIANQAAPLSERVPVLTYGSNANPSKITWLRENLGLTGPVPVMRARCTGLAAVWASGLRVVDTQRPVTLAAMAGTETHALWLADEAQVKVLDVCEGRGDRYHLARVHTGHVSLEDGSVWDAPLAYTANAQIRLPLYVDGRPVRSATVDQEKARDLTGKPGPTGLSVSVVDGSPRPEDFPARVFVYGTLRPGSSAWDLVAPHVLGEPYPATIKGTVFDTGFGYPGLLPGNGDVSGWVLPLGNPDIALATLDSYEGGEYRRVRVVTSGSTVCWAYRWIA